MKKTLVTASVAAVVAATSLGGLGLASAATNSSTKTDPMSSLVSAIAKKFNLKQSDVQAVFDANRTQMDAQRETEAKDQVAQLVKDGKLNQSQADLINTKRAELQKQHKANRTSMDSKTDAERKSAMDTERTALDKWFTDNNISTDYRYLVFGSGHGGPGGPGGPRGTRGGHEDKTSSGSITSNNSSSDSTTN